MARTILPILVFILTTTAIYYQQPHAVVATATESSPFDGIVLHVLPKPVYMFLCNNSHLL